MGEKLDLLNKLYIIDSDGQWCPFCEVKDVQFTDDADLVMKGPIALVSERDSFSVDISCPHFTVRKVAKLFRTIKNKCRRKIRNEKREKEKARRARLKHRHQ